MTRHIAFISEALDTATPANETTLALMHAAQTNGFRTLWMESSDLHIKNNVPVGYMVPVEVAADHSIQMGESFLAPLDRIDLLWWRKASPYSVDDLFVLDILQMLEGKTPVVNNPRSIRTINEQLYTLQFGDLTPPTLVTKSPKAIQAFLSEVGGKAVIRSLNPNGNNRSFFLRMGDPNLNTLSQALTDQGTRSTITQKLITEPGLDGDKRIFMLDGEFLDIALQIPAIGELRGSFEQGSAPASIQPSDKDLKVAQVVGQQLKKDGIFFAAIDVSDGLIVGIQLSNPAGLPQLNEISGENYSNVILRRLVQRYIAS